MTSHTPPSDLGVIGAWSGFNDKVEGMGLAHGETFQRSAFSRGGRPRSVFQPRLAAGVRDQTSDMLRACDQQSNFVPMWNARSNSLTADKLPHVIPREVYTADKLPHVIPGEFLLSQASGTASG